MKKILFIIPAVLAAAAFFGCDSDKTELSFTNAHDSDDAINEIIWEGGDASWAQTNGWAQDATTDSKEVSKTTGIVTCSIWVPDPSSASGGDWGAAMLSIDVNGTVSEGAIPLKKGASNNFTLLATNPNSSASIKKASK